MNYLLISFIITVLIFIILVQNKEHLQVANKSVLYNIQSTAETCNEKPFRLNSDVVCDNGYVLKDMKFHATKQRPSQEVINSYWGKPPSGMTWADLANLAQNGTCLPCYNNENGTCRHIWSGNTTGTGFNNWYKNKENMRSWGMNNYRGCDLKPTLADIQSLKCCKLQVNNV
jgi:hypothetical protein